MKKCAGCNGLLSSAKPYFGKAKNARGVADTKTYGLTFPLCQECVGKLIALARVLKRVKA